MRRFLILPALLLACSDATPVTPPSDVPPAPSDTATDASVTDTPPADVPIVDVPAADVPAADAPPADVPPAQNCGTDRPDLSAIGGSEGLVIAADGTVYYSQAGGVGRMRPGMDPENAWVRLTGASTVWGLALDPVMRRLYVGVPSSTPGRINALDLSTDPPTVSVFLTSAGGPNGLTLGPDGALWYTDFNGGAVYRVTPEGARTRVTATTLANANGIAFGPDGSLYVDSYAAGTVVRLTLVNNMETGRTVVATGAGRPDGLALDAMGRFYVTDNSGGVLYRYDADGTNRTRLVGSLSAPANVEFGVGSLSCSDIYVATGRGVVRFEDGDTAGAAVPWHR